jgi:hypothetical protein
MRLLAATVLVAFSPVLMLASTQVPDSCPVTKPSQPPFQPPAPYPSDGLLIGSPQLWTSIPPNGVWNGLGHYSADDSRFRQKLLWWSEGYHWRTENPPHLVITGTRLDGLAPPLETDGQSNAGWTNDGDHPFIVAGIFIPTSGCWKITGQYNGAELSYVVWVTEECKPEELGNLLRPTDPAYEDAMDLASALGSHGIIVKCVLPSKWTAIFEGQLGAALFRTDYGDFEALFLPKGQNFDSLISTERHENGRFLYTLDGYSRNASPHSIDSKFPMYFVNHANALFLTWHSELPQKLLKSLG